MQDITLELKKQILEEIAKQFLDKSNWSEAKKDLDTLEIRPKVFEVMVELVIERSLAKM